MNIDRGGRTGTYILLLLTGTLIGIVGGGEFVRYLGTVKEKNAQQAGGAGPQSAGSSAAQETASAASVAPADDIAASRDNAIVRATRMVAPGVVGIVVTQIQVVSTPYYSNDFFDLFFSPQYVPRIRQVENMGSGFVIRADGLILTNNHVVDGARELFVNFPDGRQMRGSVAGYDEKTDIAVIKVDAAGLKPVVLGNSDQLMIGEWAIAIGNPFLNFMLDAHPTVTVGVVSALDRNFTPSEGVYYQSMIQTDAAINPGNSGGPLINALGEVIGINTFIYTGSRENKGSIGIGFAIPINRAHRVAQELIQYGKRRHPWTGIAVKAITREVALALGFEKADGVVVMDVQKNSPGESAGFKRGDIIVRLGRQLVRSTADIEVAFVDFFVEDRIPVTFVRQGKELKTVLVLKEYPRQP